MIAALYGSLAISSSGCAPSSIQNANSTKPATVAVAPESQPEYWVGKNIGDVVRTFGHSTVWYVNHEGGGNRYVYDNPNQPHFVFETGPAGVITKASKIP